MCDRATISIVIVLSIGQNYTNAKFVTHFFQALNRKIGIQLKINDFIDGTIFKRMHKSIKLFNLFTTIRSRSTIKYI